MKYSTIFSLTLLLLIQFLPYIQCFVKDKTLAELQEIKATDIWPEWEAHMQNFDSSDMMTLLILKHPETLFEEIEKGSVINGAYFVKQGRAPVEMKIIDPDGVTIFYRRSNSEGVFYFTAEKTGEYQFVLQAKTLFGGYWVTFCFHKDGASKDKLVNPGDLDPLAETMRKALGHMNEVQVENKVAFMRQDVHAKLVQSNHKTLFYVAIIETILIITVTFWQIKFTKNIFERKSIL